jgi:LytTr DNA-binding domain
MLCRRRTWSNVRRTGSNLLTRRLFLTRRLLRISTRTGRGGVHRSHIVNIERVVGYKRSGDNEMVKLDAAHQYVVPVSRGRLGTLRSRIATINGSESVSTPRRGHQSGPE